MYTKQIKIQNIFVDCCISNCGRHIFCKWLNNNAFVDISTMQGYDLGLKLLPRQF